MEGTLTVLQSRQGEGAEDLLRHAELGEEELEEPPLQRGLVLVDAVGRADAVLLLQTGAALRRPSVLLGTSLAATRGLPIVPIHVVGRGYEFARAKALLSDAFAEHHEDAENANVQQAQSAPTQLPDRGQLTSFQQQPQPQHSQEGLQPSRAEASQEDEEGEEAEPQPDSQRLAQRLMT